MAVSLKSKLGQLTNIFELRCRDNFCLDGSSDYTLNLLGLGGSACFSDSLWTRADIETDIRLGMSEQLELKQEELFKVSKAILNRPVFTFFLKDKQQKKNVLLLRRTCHESIDVYYKVGSVFYRTCFNISFDLINRSNMNEHFTGDRSYRFTSNDSMVYDTGK